MGDVSTSNVVLVDPQTGQSQLTGQLALAVHDASGASIGGRAFIFGGGAQSTVASVQTWQSGTGVIAGACLVLGRIWQA